VMDTNEAWAAKLRARHIGDRFSALERPRRLQAELRARFARP